MEYTGKESLERGVLYWMAITMHGEFKPRLTCYPEDKTDCYNVYLYKNYADADANFTGTGNPSVEYDWDIRKATDKEVDLFNSKWGTNNYLKANGINSLEIF